MVFKFLLQKTLCQSMFSVLMARMVAPQRATKCRGINSNKEMKIRLPVISVNISLNVFQRPGQDLGWRRRWNKPVPSPRFNQSLNEKSNHVTVPFLTVTSFLILVFWSGTIEMSYNKRRKLDIKSAILNTSIVVGHMLRIIPVFYY